jgi:hypothetical protein
MYNDKKKFCGVRNMKYEAPNIEIVEILQHDIITKSPETIVPDPNPPVDENEPDWGIPF